jgi:hypothetical protein
MLLGCVAYLVDRNAEEPSMGQRETERLNEIVFGAALAVAVCTAAELGVADHIRRGSPRSTRHLAEATRTLEAPLYRLMRLLASHGLFAETEEGEFDHTALSEALRGDADGSYRAAAQIFHNAFAAWGGLEHALRTGQSGFEKIYGKPVFENVAEHPGLGPVVDDGMSSIHGYETSAMLDVYDFSGVRVLADVGGGNGSLLGAVLQRYPQMRGLLFDRGHVAERARRNLEARGLSTAAQCSRAAFSNPSRRGRTHIFSGTSSTTGRMSSAGRSCATAERSFHRKADCSRSSASCRPVTAARSPTHSTST